MNLIFNSALLTVYNIAYNMKWEKQDSEWWVQTDVEESGDDIWKYYHNILPLKTKENHKKPKAK